MELPDTFLTVDPDLWKDREDYQKAAESVHAIKVVNDHAERSMALIQEFSGLMTHDELQLQYFAASCSTAPSGLSRHQERDTLCLYQNKLRKLH